MGNWLESLVWRVNYCQRELILWEKIGARTPGIGVHFTF